MIPFRLETPESRPLSVLCLGAHGDDIEIGCGATILRLIQDYKTLAIRWIVMGATGEREREARESAGCFLAGTSDAAVEIHAHRDGYFPSEWAGLKARFESLKGCCSPDLIFTHWGGDAHQDHRVMSELTWNTWRDHLILEYEIPKYDGDLGRPGLFSPVADDLAQRKITLLRDCFRTQAKKSWFTEETFLGLMRLRAIEARCRENFAEAFHLRKALF